MGLYLIHCLLTSSPIQPNIWDGMWDDKEQLRKYREGELVVFRSNITVPQYAPDDSGEYQGASHLYEGAHKLNKAKNKGEKN